MAIQLAGFDQPGFTGQISTVPQAPAAAAAPKGSFLTHLFPTIGGIGGGALGGAAGGALAGTAVLPGVGTLAGGLIGALAGGAAGGAAGKVAENKVEGKSLGSGVAGQALEQGVLSAGPIRLLKGAGVASKAALGGGSSLLDALGQGGAVDAQLAAPGLLGKFGNAVSTKGQQMEARAGGFGVGEKAAGGVQLGVHDSAAIGDLLKSQGIAAGSPESRLAAVENKLGTVGQQIDSHINANNVTLQPADVKQMAADYLHNVQMQPGLRPPVLKAAQDFASNLENQVKDTKSLVGFRRGLDQQVINFNANGQGASPAAQIAARTLRNVLSDKTNQLAPGISDLNKTYSGLTDAAEFLKGGAKAVSDQSQGGGGLVSRLLTNDTAQAAKSHAGSLLQKTASGGANPVGAGAITARSLPVGALQAASSAIQPVTNNSASQVMNPQNSTANMDTLSQTPDQTSSSPFDPANIETNIQKIIANGGNMKDVTDYVSLASSINSLQQKAGGSTKLSGTQAQQAANAQSGLQSLQTIADTLKQNPNAAKEANLPGGSLISNLTGTGEYKAAIANASDVIGRLRSGGAISADEEKRFMSMLPSAFDNQATTNYKLNQMANLFQSFANPQSVSQDQTSLIGALGQ